VSIWKSDPHSQKKRIEKKNISTRAKIIKCWTHITCCILTLLYTNNKYEYLYSVVGGLGSVVWTRAACCLLFFDTPLGGANYFRSTLLAIFGPLDRCCLPPACTYQSTPHGAQFNRIIHCIIRRCLSSVLVSNRAGIATSCCHIRRNMLFAFVTQLATTVSCCSQFVSQSESQQVSESVCQRISFSVCQTILCHTHTPSSFALRFRFISFFALFFLHPSEIACQSSEAIHLNKENCLHVVINGKNYYTINMFIRVDV